ncbi:hypothetical protein N665_0012s0263 [Sinapis alba]|nr:hypothetical protein N665_0012s0263 [Sinapis alba]
MVYLSFDRCDDIIRYFFISHLSASLSRKGMIVSSSSVDKSSKESTANIKNFEFFVVVISEKYSLSAECLNEHDEIVVCKQNNNVVVVPVFYDISSSELINRSDSLGDLLRQGNYSTDQQFCWKSALTTDSYKPR